MHTYQHLLLAITLFLTYKGAVGNKSVIIKHPYQAQVELKTHTNEHQHVAVGAIISCKFVVTLLSPLLHDRKLYKPENIFVRSGSGQLLENGGRHPLRKIIAKDGYPGNNVGDNDIALLELWYNFHFSHTVSPIPIMTQVLRPGNIFIVGWSKVNKGSQIQWSSANFINWTSCADIYKEKKNVNISIATSCVQNSDSNNVISKGSSLILQENLQGLMLFPPSQDSPGVFVDISNYTSWIQKITNNTIFSGNRDKICEQGSPPIYIPK